MYPLTVLSRVDHRCYLTIYAAKRFSVRQPPESSDQNWDLAFPDRNTRDGRSGG